MHHISRCVDLLQSTCYQDIVCYGIGRIGMCYIACHQLALLLHMAKEVRVNDLWALTHGSCRPRV